MDTIKNYLETMFASMPNTAEVRKAKAELLQMMEDKYNELISEGQSENTAVGTVISEFGNLDELAEDLGLSKEVEETHAKESELPRRQIGMEDAMAILSNRMRKSLFLAIGVMGCIISVAWPVILAAVNPMAGVGLMFASIAIGVGFIVYSSFVDAEWKFLNTELCRIDMATAAAVKERKRSFESVRALCTTLGVILCIICWVPNLFVGKMELFAPGMMFFLIGFGVMLIVYASKVYSGFEKLLQINDIGSVGDAYEAGGKAPVRYKSKAAETIVSIYWPVVTCIYLIVSFLTFQWALTWIIWPIAAVLRTVVVINCRVDEE